MASDELDSDLENPVILSKAPSLFTVYPLKVTKSRSG